MSNSLSARRVFISYAHEDEKALEALLQQLKPHLKAGRFEVWTDREIKTGERWRETIGSALDSADLAVFLVTPAFLASDFITDVEVPTFLRREEEGKAQIFSVAWSASTVDRKTYSFESRTGEHKQAKLTDFQFFNDPASPLDALPRPRRQQQIADLVRQILDALPAEKAPRPTNTRRYGSSAASTPIRNRPTASLDIDLTVEGETLHLEHRAEGGRTFPGRSFHWPSVRETLEPIHEALDNYRPDKLDEWLRQKGSIPGATLFGLLFGEATDWVELFKALFPSLPRPSPAAGAVRLRLRTSEPVLLGLPWRLLTYEHRSLVVDGWTMSTTSAARDSATSRATPITEPNQDVVILASADAAEAGLDSRRWIDVLAEHWGKAAGERVRLITQRSEIDHGPAPHLLVVLAGPSCARTSTLRFPDGELALTKLVDEWARGPDALVLCCGAGRGLAEPVAELGRQVPLVVWQRLGDASAATEAALLGWLGHWLAGDLEPAEALHHWPRPGSTNPLPRPTFELGGPLATCGLHAAYTRWTTRGASHHPREVSIRDVLDRIHAKSRAATAVADLVRNGRNKVIALVSYAAPGQAAHSSNRQKHHFVEDHLTDQVRIQSRTASLPDVRHGGTRQLTEEFEALFRKDEEPRRHMLGRLGPNPRNIPHRQHGVLWLDWGTYGGAHAPPLRASDLGAWIGFCNDYLSHHCPEKLSIVCFLALEVEEAKHPRLRKLLEDFEIEHQDPAFRFVPLPVLGTVPLGELVEALRLTRCPTNLRREMAELLHAATGGLFEPLVERIEEGQRDGWASLRARLQQDHDPPQPDDDETF